MADPLASFGGLATGLDTNALVSGLVGVEKLPIRRLEVKQADLTAINNKLKSVGKRLDSISEDAESLDTVDKFLKKKVTSEGNKYFSASVLGSASNASYAINVTQIAQAQINVSDGISDKTTEGLLTDGTLQVTVGTEDPVSFTVDSTTTLNSLARSINSELAGAEAAVIYDGTNYRLRIVAEDTNTAVSFDDGTTNLNLSASANQLKDPQSAALTIDGLAITSDKNEVAGAIPGVTLTLTEPHSASSDTSNLTVATDTDSTVSTVQNFVNHFNSVAGFINLESAYKGYASLGTSLAGDSMLRNIQSQMGYVITTPVDGLSGDYTLLKDVGLEMTQTGTLKFTSGTMIEALQDDVSAVADLFIENTDNSTEGIFAKFQTMVEDYTGTEGSLTERIKGVGEEISDIGDQIVRMEDRVEKYEENLRKQFTRLEVTVSNLTSQGDQLLAMMGTMNRK